MAGCTQISLGQTSPITVKPGTCLQVPAPPAGRAASNHVLASVTSTKTQGTPIQVRYCSTQGWSPSYAPLTVPQTNLTTGKLEPGGIPGTSASLRAANGSGSFTFNASYPNAFTLIDTCPPQAKLSNTRP